MVIGSPFLNDSYFKRLSKRKTVVGNLQVFTCQPYPNDSLSKLDNELTLMGRRFYRVIILGQICGVELSWKRLLNLMYNFTYAVIYVLVLTP